MCVAFGQETRLKYIGIESGISFIESAMSNMDYVRGYIPSYDAGYSSNSLASLTYKSFIGIKTEIFSLSDRIGLSGGIRFSRIYSSVGKNDYWTNSTNYFYWLYRQDGVTTEFLKVNEVNQRFDYVGIPIEIRYFTARRPRKVRLYFKIGTEFNFLVQSQRNIVFNNIAMNSYESDLLSKIDKPKTFYCAMYSGAGIRLGRELKPSISIEACFPYLFLTSHSSGLVDPTFGGGFQVNVQIPIKPKVK